MNIIFLGRKKYAAELIEWTLQRNINIIAIGTDISSENTDIKKKANEYSIPLMSFEEIKEYILKHPLEVELVVSYLYMYKLNSVFFDIPKFGCINFHPAILPNWRGTAGYNLAILNKLEEWGASAHYVNAEIDMGPIIRVHKFNFDYRLETASSLERKTQLVQMDLYKSVVLDVELHGRLSCMEQKKEDGIYVSRRQMNELKILDINNMNNEEIDLNIRAFWFPPHSGAGIIHEGKHYSLVNEEILKRIERD